MGLEAFRSAFDLNPVAVLSLQPPLYSPAMRSCQLTPPKKDTSLYPNKYLSILTTKSVSMPVKYLRSACGSGMNSADDIDTD